MFTRRAPVVILSIAATAGAAPDCSKYAADGFCDLPKYKTYMERHCASFCSSGEETGGASGQDDGRCASWAADGYCENADFKEYMSENCPNACGSVRVAVADDASVAAAQDEEDVYVAEDDGDDGAAALEDSQTEPASAPSQDAEAAAASESPDCDAWARQGLCGGQHAEYMRQNCAATCELVEAEGGAPEGGGGELSSCVGWARQGFCESTHTHAAYMAANCAEACERESRRDPKDDLPPPFDWWLGLGVCGFGYVVYWLIRRALAVDAGRSSKVRTKTLGEAVTIGEGKPNPGAFNIGHSKAPKARSSKKGR